MSLGIAPPVKRIEEPQKRQKRENEADRTSTSMNTIIALPENVNVTSENPGARPGNLRSSAPVALCSGPGTPDSPHDIRRAS
jgi:hypothetical protein